MTVPGHIPTLVLCLVTFALAAPGCGGEPAPPTPQRAASTGDGPASPKQVKTIRLSVPARQAVSLTTAQVQSGLLRQEIETTAVIKPNEYRMAHVSPRITGKALRVEARLGDRVKAGEVLAEIDSIELGERKAAFLQARTNLEVARRNYQREKSLYDEQISSEREYLAAKGEFERSEAAYRATREALRLLDLSDSQIGRLTWSVGGSRPLSHFPLKAPFAATVISRHITPGELIRPADRPFTIADLSTVWVIVDLYERSLGRVGVGDEAKVIVDAYPGETFNGRIVYISDVVQQETRTAPARVEIPNSDRRLRPGMFATVRIALRPTTAARVALIPVDAVQRIHGRAVVFVEQEPGAYRVRRVTLGNRSERNVEVLSGLKPGEHVVTGGAFYLKSVLLKEQIGGEE